MKLIGELLNLDEAYEFLDEETEKEKREKRNTEIIKCEHCDYFNRDSQNCNNPNGLTAIKLNPLEDYCSKANAVMAESAINPASQTLSERNSGEWIQLENGSWWCRFCGENDPLFKNYNYCPECGAKMRRLKNECRNQNND